MVGCSPISRDGGAPSQAKTAFDQAVVPALIDVAGDIEAVLERVAIRTRQSPAYALAAAFGLGMVLSLTLLRQRRP